MVVNILGSTPRNCCPLWSTAWLVQGPDGSPATALGAVECPGESCKFYLPAYKDCIILVALKALIEDFVGKEALEASVADRSPRE